MFAGVKSYLGEQLKQYVLGSVFPNTQSDWYIRQGYSSLAQAKADRRTPFNNFLAAQRKPDGRYHLALQGLRLTQSFIDTKLANGESCSIETVSFAPPLRRSNKARKRHRQKSAALTLHRPAIGKHVVFFTGMGDTYQGCFEDIAINAKTTGATVHAFNYPGHPLDGGKLDSAIDMINAGIAVVNTLVKQGTRIDDIVLQGDSLGSGIAYEVKRQFKLQSGVDVRIIMDNTFATFEEACLDGLKGSSWAPSYLKSQASLYIKSMGWDLRAGDDYGFDGPYQTHFRHVGDKTITGAHLANRVEANLAHPDWEDNCPEEYREARDRLVEKNKGHVKTTEAKRYHDNPHLANLWRLELEDGRDAYRGFVNDYHAASQAYVKAHPQRLLASDLPEFIASLDEHRTPKQTNSHEERPSTAPSDSRDAADTDSDKPSSSIESAAGARGSLFVSNSQGAPSDATAGADRTHPMLPS